MLVKVNRDVCQGHARCHALAPAVFALDELGYNVGGVREIADEHAEQVFAAEAACPERAISVTLT